MSKMKSILKMYALTAMAMNGDLGGVTIHEKKYIEPKETEEERKARLTKAEIERKKSNGLKEFFYGENSVWAINQKNADKKARNKHWL